MVANPINIIGIVVERSLRVMLEMIVISGPGQFFGRGYIIRHIAAPMAVLKVGSVAVALDLHGVVIRPRAAVAHR
jgi:hypothetical protein